MNLENNLHKAQSLCKQVEELETQHARYLKVMSDAVKDVDSTYRARSEKANALYDEVQALAKESAKIMLKLCEKVKELQDCISEEKQTPRARLLKYRHPKVSVLSIQKFKEHMRNFQD